MKSMLAAALFAVSLFSGSASADDAKAETIVIYAVDMADAQQQIEAAQRDVGSSVIIIRLMQPDGTTIDSATQRDVGSSVIII